MAKTLEEARAKLHQALKTNIGVEEAIAELGEYRMAHPEEVALDPADFEEPEEDEEEYEEDEGFDEDYDYEYDSDGNAHYVGHKSWEQRAWEDSGMTWADFI